MFLKASLTLLSALNLFGQAVATAAYDASTVRFDNVRRLLFDTDGRQVDAYGAKVQYFNGSYYLYGNSFSTTGVAFGIKSYRSADLTTWEAQGNILSPALTQTCAEGVGGCGRPHMLFNAKTNKYVLWLNVGSDGYLVATSSSPAGPFDATAARASIDPQFTGLQPADFSIEQANGKAYVVYSILNFRYPDAGSIWPPIQQNLHVQQLTDDYLSTTNGSWPVVSAANDLIDNEAESADLAYLNGQYYISASNTCGYCNGSIALLYRSESIRGPWTRQILAGDSCRGQVEGLATLPDPKTGKTSLIWHSTSVPGGPRIGFGGHIFQPLNFNSDGSAQNLNCAADASFPVSFTKGAKPVITGALLGNTDATPANAVYDYVCDSDQFDLFQTWTASKNSTLKSVSVNVARGAQTTPLSLTLFTGFDLTTSAAPNFQWTVLGQASFNASALSYTFDTATVAANPGTQVRAGQLLGLAMTGSDLSPYCHLEYSTGGDGSRVLFQRGSGQNSWRGIDGRKSVVYRRAGRGVKLFASYA